MTFPDSCALLSSRIFSLFIPKKIPRVSVGGPLVIKRYYDSKKIMELVSVPPIVTAYRHALRTFDTKFESDLPSNFNKLKALMDIIKAEDLGFDKMLMNPETWAVKGKAPCTYIEVFKNDQINMSIFVLKPGFKMPLHDHPEMHGLLKVISGSVHIRSFSEYPLKEKNTPEFYAQARIEAARLASGHPMRRKLFAQVSTSKKCRANSEACILTPTISNYHEIQALELPAAFFDILAPPYDTMIEGIGPRRCRYYQVTKQLSNNIVELEETEVPECFYCDQAPYLGPMIGPKKTHCHCMKTPAREQSVSISQPLGMGSNISYFDDYEDTSERRGRWRKHKCCIIS